MDAAERREARKRWTGQVFHSWEEAEEADTLFWLGIPPSERARAVWELSEELHRIAHPNTPRELRLDRSVCTLTRC